MSSMQTLNKNLTNEQKTLTQRWQQSNLYTEVENNITLPEWMSILLQHHILDSTDFEECQDIYFHPHKLLKLQKLNLQIIVKKHISIMFFQGRCLLFG